MFKLTAFADETEGIYVYYVDHMPKDTPHEDVATYVFAKHGTRFRSGEVKELLRDLYTITWVNGRDED